MGRQADKKRDEIITKYYPAGGAPACRNAGLKLTTRAICSRASALGLKRASRRRATPEVDRIIRDVYPTGLAAGCVAAGVDAPKNWIRGRASELGVTTRKAVYWTNKEVEILREYWPIEGIKCAHRIPRRSAFAVKRRAIELGLKRDPKRSQTLRRQIDECGISPDTYYRRRAAGMDHIEALMTPVNTALRDAARKRHRVAA